MKKVALVLSGGGAKGAFQAGAERYAREVKGYEWGVISGVSIGAMNGAMLAMRRYDRLRELWRTITTEQVYGGMSKFAILRRLARGYPSLFPIDRLRAIVERDFDEDAFEVDFRVGAVSLVTGEFLVFRPGDEGFMDAILASGAMPLFFPPVPVTPELPAMIDGGVSNMSPISSVLDAHPDEVVIINCSPRQATRLTAPPTNAFRIGHRALEIMMTETFSSDVGKFLRMNRLVEQAESAGITLRKEDGRPFRRYPCVIIEPDERLGNSMDLSRANVERCLQAGWEKAKKVLG